MKYILAIIIGILIATMININGVLGVYTNAYFSSFIVHLIATIGTTVFVLKNKEIKNKKIKLSILYYCGGVMGAIIVVISNVSFKTLGVSITVALILLGQVMASTLIDSYGLLNMKKIVLNKGKIPGLVFMILGITIMMFY